jgi:hypothetical protein
MRKTGKSADKYLYVGVGNRRTTQVRASVSEALPGDAPDDAWPLTGLYPAGCCHPTYGRDKDHQIGR